MGSDNQNNTNNHSIFQQTFCNDCSKIMMQTSTNNSDITKRKFLNKETQYVLRGLLHMLIQPPEGT